MKSIYRISIVILLALASFSGVHAQKKSKVASAEFAVEGVCGMCKSRIENAALIKGVKMANWNQETGKIALIYKPSKVDLNTIHQALADAGHDTDKIKATDEAYKNMPGCCDYRGGVKSH
jgi:copper chaperone CopZ